MFSDAVGVCGWPFDLLLVLIYLAKETVSQALCSVVLCQWESPYKY